MEIDQNEAHRLMDAEELAIFLGWTLQRVWAAARAGHIPCLKVGRRRYFPRRAVEAWLEGCVIRSVEEASGPDPVPGYVCEYPGCDDPATSTRRGAHWCDRHDEEARS